MKTMLTFILLLAVTVVLSSCSRRGMGHRYMNSSYYGPTDTGYQYMEGNTYRSNSSHMR